MVTSPRSLCLLRTLGVNLCFPASPVGEQRSIPRGAPVVARISGAEPVAGFGIDANRVDQSDVAAALCRKAPRLQLFLYRLRKILLHQNQIRQPLVMETRSVY